MSYWRELGKRPSNVNNLTPPLHHHHERPPTQPPLSSPIRTNLPVRPHHDCGTRAHARPMPHMRRRVSSRGIHRPVPRRILTANVRTLRLTLLDHDRRPDEPTQEAQGSLHRSPNHPQCATHMSKAKRRKDCDQAPPDRAALAEARLQGLSLEVRRACERWLAAKGIKAPSFTGEWPNRSEQRAPEPSSAQPDSAERPDTPGV